jgi:hypothetical protein
MAQKKQASEDEGTEEPRPVGEPHPDEPTGDGETSTETADQDKAEPEAAEPLPGEGTTPEEGATRPEERAP